MKILNELGADKIQAYLEELTDYLCDLLNQKGYKIISSREKGEKSQIVSLMPKEGQTSMEVFSLLEQKKIIISARGERLRISPHIFNNRSDIDKLIEEIP